MAKASRSLRRHHVDRVKAATRIIGRRVLFRGQGESPEAFAERIQAWANRTHQHRKTCSCEMCCNPRRSKLRKKERLTMAERRALASAREDHL